MHTIVSTKERIHWLTDAGGNLVSGEWPARDVAMDFKYELGPSPHQPLVVDIHGSEIFCSPQCAYKLILDNGVVLTGRASSGGTFKFGDASKARRVRMFDVDEGLIQLYPSYAANAPQEIDSAVYEDLLNGFARMWEDNRANKGTFHIALQLLRGGDKGWPRSRPSVTYLRNAFTACAFSFGSKSLPDCAHT